MRATNLQELRVYRKALAAANAVSALLKRPALSKDFDLKDLGHLNKALNENFISQPEHSEVAEMYDHVGRMLTRWIDYLQDSDWKDRG
jgi:hypothetical protein